MHVSVVLAESFFQRVKFLHQLAHFIAFSSVRADFLGIHVKIRIQLFVVLVANVSSKPFLKCYVNEDGATFVAFSSIRFPVRDDAAERGGDLPVGMPILSSTRGSTSLTLYETTS